VGLKSTAVAGLSTRSDTPQSKGAFMHIALKRPSASSAVRIGTVAALALGTVGILGMARAPATTSQVRQCSSSPTVSRAPFGKTIEPYTGKLTQVYRYTLTNCNRMQVRLLTFGGIQQSIMVPGRNGKLADVILGFKTLKDYVTEDSPPVTANGGPYFGENIGRYGNRIAKGTFTLDGVTYHVPINNNGNSLHGGLIGFGDHIYAAKEVHSAGSAGVAMTIVSPNGDQGYPGTLTETVTFTLNNSNELKMHYHATVAGKATVVNFTNHDYFNLAGESSGSAYNQVVQINANRYTPTDKTQIPTGVLAPVKGTPFDFTTPHTIGSRINQDNAQLLIAQGYDHNWVLNKSGPTMDGLRLASHAWDPASGRELTVWTDQPGVQFYSGNFLTGTLVGISNHIYRQSDGYTFETQHFPNSPNQPNFPSTVLNPGQAFNSTTIYQFSS
jgi:aldose 1-epimerase